MAIHLQGIDCIEKNTKFEKKYITPIELEEIYGFSKSWQSKKRMVNAIPYIKIGGHVRYSVESINRWLEEHQV